MDMKKLSIKLKALTIVERRKVAKKTGVAYTTLNNIAYGYTKNPGISAVVALQKVLNT